MEFIKKHESPIVYSLLMGMAFITWCFNISLFTFTLFCFLFIGNALFLKRDKYSMLIILLLPTLFNDLIGHAFMSDFEDLSAYYIFIIPIAFVYGIMLYKIIVNRKNIGNKELFIGILIYFGSMLPSFINTLNIYNSLLETLVYLNTVILYFYFVTSTKIKKTDFYLIIILFALQGIIQMTYELLDGDTLEMIRTKAIGVGWSKQNNLAQYAAFALPLSLYFAAKLKGFGKYLYYFVAVVFVVSVFLTSARTTMVSLFVIFIPMMWYLYKNASKEEFKRNFIVLGSGGVIVLITLFATGIAGAFIERMTDVGLDDTYRIDHWIKSIDHFKAYPIIGSGILTTSDYLYPWLPSYHNVFVDALTNTGIIGFAGTCYFLYVLTKILIKDKRNFIIGMALVTFFVAANLDTVHINPIALMMMFMSFKFIESKNAKLVQN